MYYRLQPLCDIMTTTQTGLFVNNNICGETI